MKLPKTSYRAIFSFILRSALLRVRGLGFRERKASEIAAQELLKIDSCWSAIIGFGMVDPIRCAEIQTRHLLLALKAGEPYRIARALAAECSYIAMAGQRNHNRSEKLLQIVKSLAERVENPHARALALMEVGMVAFCEGRWAKAFEYAARAENLLREECTGVTWELNTLQIFILRSLILIGDIDKVILRFPLLLKEAQERGDLYAEVNLLTRISYVVAMIADQPERGLADSREAIAQWSQEGFHAQHFFDLVGHVEIALYNGDDNAAYQLMAEKWRLLSLILQIQVLKIELLHLRARATLARVAKADDGQIKALLKAVEQDAKRIEREKIPWGNALVTLINATVLAARGKIAEAIHQLAQAESELKSVDMHLYAAAALYRRGQLMNNDAGAALMASSLQWMKDKKIKNPVKFIAMLAPWPLA
jgi:tetratricopeptide (TPR) repeat protein